MNYFKMQDKTYFKRSLSNFYKLTVLTFKLEDMSLAACTRSEVQPNHFKKQQKAL
jgi:hypothetical protein